SSHSRGRWTAGAGRAASPVAGRLAASTDLNDTPVSISICFTMKGIIPLPEQAVQQQGRTLPRFRSIWGESFESFRAGRQKWQDRFRVLYYTLARGGCPLGLESRLQPVLAKTG